MPTKSTKSLKPVKAAKKQARSADALNAITLSPTELHHLISQRAYEIFRRRGADWGSELNDWLLAEQEITAATQSPAQVASQIVAAEPAPITTKTQRTSRPASVKATERRSSTTTRARRKPAPEV